MIEKVTPVPVNTNFHAQVPPYLYHLRCPSCRIRGTFDAPYGTDWAVYRATPGGPFTVVGQRRCPNTECACHVFIVVNSASAGAQGKVVRSYPAELIDFDSSSIPEPVASALAEAISCQAAGCHRAAAIMVRKTLEELCHEKQAGGSNLHQKIEKLRGIVVLPEGLFTGMMNLKLFGNDAAHVESKDYDNISHDEVAVAIDVAKEVLKGIYQLDSLVQRLEALKKTGASSATHP